MKIEQVQRCGRFVGRKELIKHLQGNRITQRQIIKAKCFECMGGYADGTFDCHIPDCALYPMMPYLGKEQTLPVQPLAGDDSAKQTPKDTTI